MKETGHEAIMVLRKADHRDLQEHQAGVSPRDLCRKHGTSDATFYTWRKKYGGMEMSDAKRLKKLLAEQMMDASTLREMLTKSF